MVVYAEFRKKSEFRSPMSLLVEVFVPPGGSCGGCSDGIPPSHISVSAANAEQSEYARLAMKEEMAQALLGDQAPRPVTRLDMLNEARCAATVLHGR